MEKRGRLYRTKELFFLLTFDNENLIMVSMTEKYFIKKRGLVLPKEEADAYGIKRVYNRCSDIDFMPSDNEVWADSLYRKDRGECVLMETAMKVINGVPLHVVSAIVFYTVEQGNLFYMKNANGYKENEGFAHLMN